MEHPFLFLSARGKLDIKWDIQFHGMLGRMQHGLALTRINSYLYINAVTTVCLTAMFTQHNPNPILSQDYLLLSWMTLDDDIDGRNY